MKMLFSAACLLWLFSCATTNTTTTSTGKRPTLRQQPKTADTVQLLYTTFVKNRQKYVNRPFSLLLEDLPMGVNEYGAKFGENSKGDSKPKGVYLNFTTAEQTRKEIYSSPGNKGLKVSSGAGVPQGHPCLLMARDFVPRQLANARSIAICAIVVL